MFTITGLVENQKETITYNYSDGYGTVEGSMLIVFLVEGAFLIEKSVGPVGQYMERDINNPLAALFVIKECFDKIISIEGDIPTAADVPDGVII